MATPYRHEYSIPQKLFDSVSLFHAGKQQCMPLHFWGPGVRDHYLLHYVISGKGTFRINQNTYYPTAGEFFLVVPQNVTHYWADENDPWEYVWITFNGTSAQRLMNMTDLSAEHPVYRPQDPERALFLMLEIFQCDVNSSDTPTYTVAKLYELISLLIREAQHPTSLSLDNENPVQRAVEYIANNYSFLIGIDDVARYAGVSQSTLYRLFQHKYHCSPIEYLTKYRVSCACTMLQHGYSVKVTSFSVGYESPFYFSSVFKKQTGHTPSEYRKNFCSIYVETIKQPDFLGTKPQKV